MNRFLRLFKGVFYAYTRNIGIFPPVGKINEQEALARFLLHSKIFSRVNGTVKADAFRSNQPISVYRIDELSRSKIWLIGKYLVADVIRRHLYGYASITVKTIYNINPTLEVKRAYFPHPRHANILNMPLNKPAQKHLAKKIATASELVLR